MGMGYLKIQVHTADDALPMENAKIIVYDTFGKIIYQTTTDINGDSGVLKLMAPDKKYTLDPNYNKPAYSVYDVDIKANLFLTKHIHGVEIVDTQTALLIENMRPIADEPDPVTDEYIDIPPIALLDPVQSRQSLPPPSAADAEAAPAAEMLDDPPEPRIIGRGNVIIPDYITVHLGIPTNASARNVRIRFSDYIKNVTSGEIYSTWPNSSLEANIHAIVTFALNRVYTEWYRSRGYNFDITNSTSYDMIYRDGGPVFENISQIVDRIFNVYAVRIGFENPFFTQFCNGTTSTCNGLSQWGTVALAKPRVAINLIKK